MTRFVLGAAAWRMIGVVMAVLSFGLLAMLLAAVAHHLTVVSQSVLPVRLTPDASFAAGWSCRLPTSILDWTPHCRTSGPYPIATVIGVALSGLMALLPLLVLAFALAQAALSYLDLSRGRLLTSPLARRTMRFAIAALAFLVIASVAKPLASWIMALFTDAFPAQGSARVETVAPTALAFEPVLRWLTPFLAASLAIHATMLVKASAIAEDHAQIV